MEIYRVPKVETSVRILLDDGRTIEGTIFTATLGPGGGPETVLDRLLDATEEFLPIAVGDERLLLNKGGIILAEAPLDAVGGELLEEGAKEVLVRITLAGGTSLLGRLAIRMPAGRTRVLDYLNAAPRFLPLLGDRRASLVHKRFIVTVRSAVEGE
jgi:hypothetical protein